MNNSDKTILHLCADLGSDSKPYRDAGYNVICVGSDIGVENYQPPKDVYGIIANPPCTEFSTARKNGKSRNPHIGLELVRECQRIIQSSSPKFFVVENPATGDLRKFIGHPRYIYQPWWYGSPWTKKTALWGNFNIPERIFHEWSEVPKNHNLYIRPGRTKPSLAFLHARRHMKYIKEFEPFYEIILRDPSRIKGGGGGADSNFRSLCSQKFAQAFFEANP